MKKLAAMDSINAAVRRDGLHKLSSRMLAADGLPAPKDWTIGEVALTLGTKLAQDRINQQSIMGGIASLYEVTEDLGEKTSSQSLYREFSRVKNLRETTGKIASDVASQEMLSYEISFWQRCKTAAANDPEGRVLGLAKIALSMYLATDAAGEKVAASPEDALQFAASFACASIVDSALVEMVKSAEITPNEALKLGALNAQAAINDLKVLTKSAGMKQALVGPAVELSSLGIPSLAAYAAARKGMFTSGAPEEEAQRKYNLLAATFVPGYTGYHFGQKHRAEAELKSATKKL